MESVLLERFESSAGSIGSNYYDLKYRGNIEEVRRSRGLEPFDLERSSYVFPQVDVHVVTQTGRVTYQSMHVPYETNTKRLRPLSKIYW